MQWYVSNQGAVVGPMSAEQLRAGIASGQITRGMHVRDESGAWTPIEGSPFGGLIGGAAPPPVVQDGGGETIGVLLLLVPLLGTGFIGWRVSNMNLLQDPMSALLTLSFGVIAVCALLIAVEANQLGMGRVRNSKGKVDSGPIAWALGTVLLFVVAYPWYLVARSRYGRKNYVVGGAVVALLFFSVTGIMGALIEEQKERVRSVLSTFP